MPHRSRSQQNPGALPCPHSASPGRPTSKMAPGEHSHQALPPSQPCQGPFPSHHVSLQHRHAMSTPPALTNTPSPHRQLPTAKILPHLPRSHFTSETSLPWAPHTSPSPPSRPHLKNFPVKSKEHSTLLPHCSTTFPLRLFSLSAFPSAHSCPSSPRCNGAHSPAAPSGPLGHACPCPALSPARTAGHLFCKRDISPKQ